jgi:hypothetical protein
MPDNEIITSESRPEVLKYIKDTTTGGVTFIKKYGISTIGAKLDRNSMYPDVMVNYMLPTGPCAMTIPE